MHTLYQLYKRRDFPYIAAAFLLGSVFHFLYEYSEENPFVALIAPVSESTWEHLKLLFFPVLFLTILEYFIRRPSPAALFGSRLAGVLAGMASIVLLFYAYTFFTVRNFLVLDILIFAFAVCITYIISGHLFCHFKSADPMLVFFGWLLITILFFSFTCYPPELGLFLPPQDSLTQIKTGL